MSKQGIAHIVSAALMIAALAGCTSLATRHTLGPDLVEDAHWSWQVLDAGTFTLARAAPANQHGQTLTIYIEGDGFAFRTPSEVSSDPTPTNPISLRLALAHPGRGPVGYLARPCQYVEHDPACTPAYWTTSRYAPEVIDAMSDALDQMKSNAGASHLILVGFSGGGAVATLLAERRSDVVGLVTVSGNLDVAKWTELGKWTPLSGSLNPATDTSKLVNIHQVHFHGTDDKIVPVEVTHSFMSKLPKSTPAIEVDVPGQSHACCWSDIWKALTTKPDAINIPGWIDKNS